MKKTHRDEIQKWARWRWEFMRHNRKVRAAWRAITRMHERGKLSPAEIDAIGLRLCDRFGIPFAVHRFPDPNMSFDEICALFGERYIAAVAGRLMPMMSAAVEHQNKYAPEMMTIHIDFSKVNSLGDLKTFVCDQIDRRAQGVMPTGRKNEVDCKQILEIGAMHRKGYTNVQIAKAKFSGDTGGPENAARKVSHILKKYHELVAGGYQTLTFP